MRAHSVCLFAAISFGTLSSAQDFPLSPHKRVVSRSASQTYNLEEMYQGEDFFSEWTFFTDPDPTHGNVNYLSEQEARDQGLAYVDGDVTYLAVDSKSEVPVGGKRNSVRISSQKSYNGGLFILDITHMPTGCGTWPSTWLVGPDWPQGGEIDIVEGVNNQEYNQMTLHTAAEHKCMASTSNDPPFTGTLRNTDCASSQDHNTGCGILSHDSNSFGHGFNSVGGGVFALLWDPTSAIKVWHFARTAIPQDITNRNPTPANWGEPTAAWSTETCNIGSAFSNNQMIIDTTICGDWAGSAYKSSGCPGTCAEMVANAGNFHTAIWAINYVAVYQ